MRKRIFITISILAVAIGLMAWDMYENKEFKKQEAIAKAESEKIYTVADILKDADFNQTPTLNIGTVVTTFQEPFPIIIENEEQQKQIMDAIKNLQLKQTKEVTALENTDYLIDLTLNKKYTLYVFEKENQIRLSDNDISTDSAKEYLYYYTILNGGDEFFDALKSIQ